ncbi:ATP-binding protein [Streptomyces sp. 8K308]|uniref:ATP-binding protein n=1 Tax=Streptomyces sp. 8K308 TaxID=2530388 RepID=UPI001FB73E2F|nr:ATP-binding protein [Streptomyces sp. 8K308]
MPRARAALHAILGGWHLDQEVIDTAELVLSELVTNAVQAPVVGGCARVEVRISHLVADGLLRLAVSDAGAGCPQPREPDAEATGGRGLLLVAALTHRWGWETRADGPGKTVWAELKAPAPAHDSAEAEVVAVTVRAGSGYDCPANGDGCASCESTSTPRVGSPCCSPSTTVAR